MKEKEFYVVYAGGSKLDLTNKDKPVAIFTYEKNVNSLIQTKWPMTGYYKKVSK
jgi:hypothetical protein